MQKTWYIFGSLKYIHYICTVETKNCINMTNFLKQLCLIIIAMFMLPTTASADDSGTCGDNVNYNYDTSNKTLTISGTGNMTNYLDFYQAPWNNYANEILSLIISEGVTSLGNYAFSLCQELRSVSLPNSLTSIGEYSFAGSSKIATIDIPQSVVFIGSCAFSGCQGLQSIIIPNSVTVIENSTFNGCTNLSSIKIHDSITRIGESAFCSCSSLTSVSIPDNVQEIGNSAFAWCTGLVNVKIGDNAYIRDNVFTKCDALYSISFGSVSYIGANVFSGCVNLKEVHISDIANWCSAAIHDNPLWYAHNLYINDEEIKDLVIPEGVTSINGGAFHKCNSIKTVTFPKSLETIGSDAFQMCEGLTTVFFEDGLKILSMGAFDRCTNLNNVYIKDLSAWCKVEMPFNDVFTYPYHLYLNDSEVKDLVIPSGIQAVGSSIFRNCISIISVAIDNSISEIGEYSFQNCSELKHLILPENLKTIRKQAFQNCNLEELIIPSSVEIINSQVFDGCYNIKNVEVLALTPPLLYDNTFSNYNIPLIVPNNCVEKYKNAQGWKNFTNILDASSVNLPETEDVEIDGIWYNLKYNEKEAEVIHGSWDLNSCWEGDRSYSGDIVIPESLKNRGVDFVVNSIGNQAFYNRHYLKSVVLPNSITKICEEAFANCPILGTVSLSNKLDIIEKRAFLQCSGLTTLTIPSSVSSIGKDAFWGCSGLNTIIVEDGNKIYDSRENCNAIIESQTNSLLKGCVNTVIPSTVTTICEGSFYNCANLSAITIPEGIASIEKGAFEGCSGITSLIMPNSIQNIAGDAFLNCLNLKEITFVSEVPPTIDGYLSGPLNCIINVPCGCYDEYASKGWRSNASNISIAAAPANKLIYIIDNQEYLSIEVCGGKPITPEAEPTKEGYTFSGWSKIPEIMPEEDVTITGSFIINKYTLTYMVDGEVYKTYEIEFGATITPEAYPTKEGYNFSGWSDIPSTMPANDVTITGSFTINKYKLTYMVDSKEYKSFEIEYGSSITPEAEPTKDGYTFSGWSEIPETMPAHDVEITGSFTQNVKSDPDLAINGKGTFIAQLGFIVTLGQPYDSPELFNPYGLSPIEWSSSNPSVATVDANGVLTLLSVGQTQIKATFAGNNEYEAGMAEYSLVVIDSSYMMDNNGNVTIIGGDLTGDITIDATVTINGQTYQVSAIAEDAFRDNQTITSLTIPAGITTIGNNAFSGCINLIVINIGKDVVSIGSRAFANVGSSKARTRAEETSLVVNCYAESVPDASSDAFENSPIETSKLLVNDNLVNKYKSTSPWSQFGKIYGFNDPSGVSTIKTDSSDAFIFDIQGNRIDNVRKGVNIIRTKDGKTKKIIMK